MSQKRCFTVYCLLSEKNHLSSYWSRQFHVISFFQNLAPHFDSSKTDFRISRVTGIKYTDSQATESFPLIVGDGAIFGLTHPFKGFAGEILTKDGPFGVSAAFLVIGANELPFGRATPMP